MKILIFGSQGQLASEFKKLTTGQKNIFQVGQEQANFLNPEQIEKLISDVKPSHIINAAAYTAVDKAESDQQTALQVNGKILGTIGEAAKKIGASVTHFSTDYVFDGKSSVPYVETDSIHPVNYYGTTKSVGESLLAQSDCKYQIFRISWVYGQYGHNFLKTMLRLGAERAELKIVSDQFGVPTLSSDVAAATWKIINDAELMDKGGIYHMAPQGLTNWHEFAVKIFEMAANDADRFKIVTQSILPITSDQFLSAAKRPQYSLLSSEKLKSTFGLILPHWQQSLASVFKVI